MIIRCVVGWRLSARLLRHCPTHGRHVLGLLLLQVPVSLPQVTDATVRDLLRWCDSAFPRPLDAVKVSICSTRAALLLKQQRFGAAVEMLIMSADSDSLRALCRKMFSESSAVFESFLVKIGQVHDI